MATLGLMFIGLLFGLFLSLVMAAFLILRMDPRLRDDLLSRRRGVLEVAATVMPQSHVQARAVRPPPELDHKLRSLQEEVRISQKLLDQAREERAESGRRQAALEEELAAVRQQLAARDSTLAESRAEVESLRTARSELDQTLTLKTAELGQRDIELRDLRTELDLARTGDAAAGLDLDSILKQRDELARTVEQLRRALAAARAAAKPQAAVNG